MLAAQAPPAPGEPGLLDSERDLRDRQRQEREERAREEADRQEIPALRGDAPEVDELPDTDERFVLQHIRFNPSEFLDEDRLTELADEYVGREIGVDDLNELLERVNALYEERELLTARAIIPPQDVGDGELRVVLVEARLESVDWLKEPERVRKSFFTDRIELAEGEVLDTSRLLRETRRLNATTPGPQLSASLAAGEEFGTTRVQLEPFEPPPWELTAFANNHGSESSGEYQAGLRGTWFSPTGNADSLDATLLGSRGTVYGSLEYRYPVNRSNGMVFGGLSRNELEIVEGPYRDLDIEGESWQARLGYEHPWVYSQALRLLGRMEYVRSESETLLEDEVPLTDVTTDRVQFGLTTTWRSGDWFATYIQTLDAARVDNAVTGHSGSHQTVGGEGLVQRRLGDSWRFVGRSSWQYASDEDELPSSLLFQLGGLGSVRGYDSGILAAPHGIDLALEAHWAFLPDWEVSALLDAGHVNDSDLPENTIGSAGLGVSYQWRERLSVSAHYAHAFTEVVPDQDSGQFRMQAEWKF